MGADEVKMGKGFGSSWADRSSSKSNGLGGVGRQGFGSNSMDTHGRIDDDDFDAGHQPLRYDDSDQEQVSRQTGSCKRGVGVAHCPLCLPDSS